MNEVRKWTGLCTIFVGGVFIAGCVSTAPLSTVIPPELTEPVVAEEVPQPGIMPAITALPEQCFERDAEIAAHVGAIHNRSQNRDVALAQCNGQLQSLRTIFGTLEVKE